MVWSQVQIASLQSGLPQAAGARKRGSAGCIFQGGRRQGRPCIAERAPGNSCVPICSAAVCTSPYDCKGRPRRPPHPRRAQRGTQVWRADAAIDLEELTFGLSTTLAPVACLLSLPLPGPLALGDLTTTCANVTLGHGKVRAKICKGPEAIPWPRAAQPEAEVTLCRLQRQGRKGWASNTNALRSHFLCLTQSQQQPASKSSCSAVPNPAGASPFWSM